MNDSILNDTSDNKTQDLVDALCTLKRALKVPELARIFNVSTRLIYQMVADGKLPAIRVCSSIRFSPPAIADWLRKNGNTEIPRKERSKHAKAEVEPRVKSTVKRTYIKVS